jgi:hypothetical protein
MSDHEVTLVNDSMQEFFVRFHGPEESEWRVVTGAGAERSGRGAGGEQP